MSGGCDSHSVTMPRVTIDNREVEVVPGSNLLAAARKLGIDVPALCYHPGCEPNTACMACVMRVQNTGRIVPACATRAEDGMRVESETEYVRGLRRTALELLLSDHDGDPSGECDCGKHSICRLRKYARLYGADAGRFRGERRAAERRSDHSGLTFDPGKCILCGICIQLAQQAGEPLGLTLVGRGFEMRVDVPLGEALEKGLQKAARRVAGACPTGALRMREEPKHKPAPER